MEELTEKIELTAELWRKLIDVCALIDTLESSDINGEAARELLMAARTLLGDLLIQKHYFGALQFGDGINVAK